MQRSRPRQHGYNMLFLSVVVPTYNRKDSLRITLDGLARQTYPLEHFEVIVVSDGSTDGTEEWLAEYAPHAPYHLRPINQKNGGPGRARNTGVAHARGDIIVFIDDDVEPVSDFLAAHAVHHETEDRIAIIGPMSPDPDRRGEEPPWIAWEHAMLAKQYDNWRTGVWKGAGPNHFYSGNASVRRAHFDAVGGFDENFKRQEDVEMAYRMQRECGVGFRFDPAAYGIHRPSRTFQSWLNIPYSYGRLDVVRATRADKQYDMMRDAYHKRSRVTRKLADIVIACPPIAAPLRATLLLGVRMAHRLGHAKVSTGLLSIIYNLRYLEAAREELGSAREIRTLIASTPPTSALAKRQ
jgi:glycosyltransferase involved in cell wall biosynthesis